eukprot:TRINITY_DN230_c0_g1_i4.p1 TRINITY_DN230_c0_g1~~TRINITY_DN230_c0_g1_i4.p1  ORF type:complete len:323 (+),score=106.91 TRINITY_DN230_c0_g1_i4:48-1016(+)
MSDQPATGERTWVDVQKKTFTRWSNTFLRYRKAKINDLEFDLHDGVLLIQLLEIISDKSLGKYNQTPKIKPQKLENLSAALKFITSQGIKLVGIGPEDIHDNNLKLILGLIWTLILRFQIQRGGPDANAKAELLEWVRQQVAPYGLRPKNFNNDWTDGKVLSALTDSLEPGTLDYKSLTGDALSDTERAMDTAEKAYQITKLMDAIDMVEMPDELAVMTYVSLFRDYWNNEMSKKADASKSFITTFSFHVQTRDKHGTNKTSGGDDFRVNITGPAAVEVQTSDNGDGTYSATYTLPQKGAYSVSILLNGKELNASPSFKQEL